MKMKNLISAVIFLTFTGTAAATAQPASQAQQKAAMQELSVATSSLAPGLSECPDPEYYKLNPILYFAIPIICQTPIQTARAEAMLYLEEEMNKPLPLLELPQFLWITVKGFGAGVAYLVGMLTTQFIPTENPAIPLPLPPAGVQAAPASQ
ncbi:MAG: hypothetical protein U9Q71_08325 [Pseudomonadota bacterium]|nr:hypothetical protein [Pseudomonadota bacterium]